MARVLDLKAVTNQKTLLSITLLKGSDQSEDVIINHIVVTGECKKSDVVQKFEILLKF